MADTTSRIIIIGSSAAGLSAAQEARKTSPEATITLISEEPHLPYHRPSLTEYIGDESVERRPQFLLQPAGWFAAQRIDLRRGIRAAGIDRQSRQVLLVSGELLPFDRLVLAVGAQPFVPMADALSRENVFAVRTLDDARRVAQCADRSHTAVIIGGGLLGLEAANALLKKKLTVTVVEMADRALPMQLDPEGSRFFERIVAASGVRLRLGVQTERIAGDTRATAVVFRSSEELPADMIIFSIGVRARVDLARSAGLTVNKGVVVNERMETSASDIYAAGDCAEFGRGVQLWMPAVRQGSVAGRNAAGGDAVFVAEDAPVVLKVFGTQLYSVGDIGRDPQVRYDTFRRMDEAAGTYQVVYGRDGRLVGGVLIGDIRRAGAISKGIPQGLAFTEAERLLAG